MNVTLLSSLRRERWLHVIQILVFVSWMMNPFPGAFSYWTLSSGVKSELANPAEDDPWYQQDGDGDGFNNAQEAQFGSDPYRLDSDLDGLPDLVEYQYSLAAITAGTPLPYDPWNWDSNGNGFSDFDEFYQQIQAYNPAVNYASLSAGTFCSYSDADGDGLKNFEDSEPFNTDRDGDQLLNWNEAAGQMDDPYNGAGPPNTDPPPQTDPGVIIGGTWYPTGTVDSDGDGTPDHLDSFPYGSFWYQGIEYGGASSDRDIDGIPDVADPFPDGSYWYNATEYAAPLVDQDGDGIPDGLDPWPTIAGSYFYNGTQYPGVMPDQDSDGTPDAFDPTPNGEAPPINQDPWNGQPHYSYGGVEYAGSWSDMDSDGIPDAQDVSPNGSYWYGGTEYYGTWADRDIDGIPDDLDALPDDKWNGVSHFTYQGGEYLGSIYDDRDGDGIPDAADAYPDDRTNRADSDSDGLSDYDETTQYGTDPAKVDTDDDRLSDSDELFRYHTNPLLAKTNPEQPYSDFYMVNMEDGDSDGIPNGIEQWYADQGCGMNPADPADARGDLDGDGYSNLQAWQNGWSLTAHSGTYDNDQDGILDVLEDAWNAAYPGMFDNHNFNDSVEDFDGDGLMNFEEIALGLNPGKANSRHTSVYDVQEWAWRGLVVGGPVGLSFAGAALNSSVLPEWQVMEDANHDGMPDGLQVFVTALNADATLVTLPQRVASGDYDGDGMRDFWEHRHNLDLRAAADAQANPDGDSLINSLEYAHDRNPLVSDDPPLEPPDDPNTTPQIVTTSLPNGSVNAGYNVGIVVSGGTGPYAFSLSSGSLPDGLFLDENGGILGTPTTEMSSSFTVQVVDGSGMSASQAFTLNVQPDAAGGGGTGGNGGDGGNQPPPLAITTTDAQMHAVIGRPYSVTLAASGGVSSHYVFTISNMGTLPAGLEYSEETHTLHGTPTATGSCSFTVTLTNASQDGFIVPGSTMGEFTLTVHDVLAFTSESELPSIMKGALFTPQLEVSGGYGQKFFSLTAGALPPGIELTSRGQFLGAPSETGLYAFTVHVTDALGQVKDQEFTLYVSEPPQPLTITTTSLPSGGIGLSYSAGIGVSGGNGDYTFTGGGGIFSVSPSGGIIGSPSEAGVYAVSITVTDSAEGTASATFVISVVAPTLTITGGDKQILKVGDTPEPVTVSLTGGGVGLAGVLVTMGSQSTITDENGSATFLPQAWMTEGPHDFAVNATGCGATVQMFAFTPPPGAGGTAPDILPGPPDDPPVTPVEDDDVIVESRSVSYTSGTLQANYSSGLAVIYANGRFQPYVAGAVNCPDYSSSKTRWTTSDGRSGEGTPPSLESLSWRRGLAGGYDRKYPDTESGPVDGPDLPGGEGGGDIWPDAVPYTIVYGGRYYGKSVGRQKHTTSQVRIRRKTAEEGGSGKTGTITMPFVDETKDTNENGVEKIVFGQLENIVLSDGQNESAISTISPTAATKTAKGENFKQVQIVPDTNMAGVIGDLVESMNPESMVKHFVTPKASTPVAGPPELNQPYVTLKALGVTEEQITDGHPNQTVKWFGGEPVSGEPLKRRVSRTSTGNGPTKVMIKSKSNDDVLAQMHVWVVWANLQINQTQIAKRFSVEIEIPSGVKLPGSMIETIWDFRATISPASITSSVVTETPNLTGAPSTMVPNFDAPHLDGTTIGQPTHKWDIARQVRLKIFSPEIGVADMYDYKSQGGTVYDGLPSPNFLIQPATREAGADSYPSNPLESNDGGDDGSSFKDNDPYTSPNSGMLTDNDSPNNPWVVNSQPPINSTTEFRFHFKEFCRLEIGEKWYRISDYKLWRLHSKMKKTWIQEFDDTDGNGVQNGNEGRMRNNESVSDDTNDGWDEP